MSPFTSNRERRLWLWSLAVVVAIYSTLGPAGTQVEALRERNLLRVSVALVLLLVVVAITGQWVKRHPGRSEIGVALGVTTAYLMAWIRIQSPEERTHLFECGLVAVLIHKALTEHLRHVCRVPAPAALAVAVNAPLGWLDEGIQTLLPNRVYDVRDTSFNALISLILRCRCANGSASHLSYPLRRAQRAGREDLMPLRLRKVGRLEDWKLLTDYTD